MDAKVLSLMQRPRWVVTIVIALAVIVWAATLYSIASQIGHPFPGFFYDADRTVNALNTEDLTGWQAGLHPNDRIVAVDGRPWRELTRIVRAVPIGTPLNYQVARGNQTLEIAVPTMQFPLETFLQFVPPWLLYSLVCLVIGVFIYIRSPASQLSQRLLVYLFLWGTAGAAWCDWTISQNKWTAFLFATWEAFTCLAGWTFFWSFPADRARQAFLARVPLIRVFGVIAVASTIYYPSLYFLASQLDRPEWWNLYTFSVSWGMLVIFAGGCVPNKFFPALQTALRKDVSPLIRHQARALFLGIVIGLDGFLFLTWAPIMIHFPQTAHLQWVSSLITSVYPLSIGYAVLRYQMFDIHIVIRKGLVYSLLTAALTATFLLLSFVIGSLVQDLTGQQSLLVAIPPALLVAFLFQPARNRIQTFVDRAFFRREYEARQTLTAFSRGLSTLRDRDQVVRLVLDTVTETLGVDRADLWLPDDGRYCPTRMRETEPLAKDKGLAIWLTQERRPQLRFPDDHSPQAQDLGRIEATLAVPLLTGEQLSGILTLGEKRSGDLYTLDDLELLTMLAHNAALALENARLHEERLAILRQQLAQVTAAQEEERQRIARELHDGVGPALASMNIRLHTARKLMERDRDAAAGEIEELAELAQTNIQDIRRLVYDLRPAILDELGLIPALKEYVARYEKDQKLEVILSMPAGDERLPAPLETALFRIIQEALANAARHAQARRVELVLSKDNQHVSVCVTDDGQGFDVAVALEQARHGGHLGLLSMGERVKQLGGQFEIESASGRGTKLTMNIPLQADVTPFSKEV
jgi:signal transduction histidine kinase